jgi:fibronectin-binding autotransporter adhesin
LGDLSGSLSQVESYNPAAAGDQTFSGTISGTGQFRRDAASSATAGRTILSAINNYSGGTVVNAGTLLVNNPFGSGTGSGPVTVNANGKLGGTGFIAGPVWCAGTIAPDTSVGTLTLESGLDLSAGGTNEWELGALTTDGAGVNFDQLALTGGELILGGTSKLKVTFTGAASAPHANHPFWLTSHTWKIVSLSGAASNPGMTRCSTLLNGEHATGSFTNYADAAGNIWLAYVAVPAPAPLIQTVSLAPAGQVVLSLATEPNRSYVLQSCTNLSQANWVDVSTNVAPAGTLTVTNALGADPLRFYRMRVLP